MSRYTARLHVVIFVSLAPCLRKLYAVRWQDKHGAFVKEDIEPTTKDRVRKLVTTGIRYPYGSTSCAVWEDDTLYLCEEERGGASSIQGSLILFFGVCAFL